MALTQVLTGGIKDDAVDNTILKLDDNFAFTGTITGAGKVLQVVSGTGTSEFDTSSTSFVKCTNLTASITPSATSSKILIMIQGTVETQQYTRHNYMDICRSIGGGSDNVNLSGQSYGLLNYYMGGTSIDRQHAHISFLDSPNTTSQCVYNPSMAFGGGNTPGAEFGKGSALQTIILMEIAG